MPSTIEFIRHLNQTAVHVNGDWLSRLQIVAGSNEVSDVAEIVVIDTASPSEFVVHRNNELPDTAIAPTASPSPHEQREQASKPAPTVPGKQPDQQSDKQTPNQSIKVHQRIQSSEMDIVDLQDVAEVRLRFDHSHAVGTKSHTGSIEDKGATGAAANSRDIKKITDQILRQYPPASPAILMFIPAQPDHEHLDAVRAIAAELANRSTMPILTLDATKNRSQVKGNGLSEVVNRSVPVNLATHPTATENLFEMHMGESELTIRKTRAVVLNKMAADLRRNFQYVCIAAPDANDVLTKTLSRYCEVAYLIIDLNTSDQREVGSHVDILRRAGARLGGCIVRESIKIDG